MILFLDDSPERAAVAYKRWPDEKRNKTIWTQTAEEAIGVLRDYAEELEEAHLDHDLGGETYVHSGREDCGMEVVRWIENLSTNDLQKLQACTFICHSWNLTAGRSMSERLKKLGLKSDHRPFGM